MGTNYYAVRNRASLEEPIHIGKSSYGWLFAFQRQNEKWHEPPVVWNTYKQVKDWLMEYCEKNSLYVIMDEYENELTVDGFFEIVDTKQKDPHCLENEDNFRYSDNVDGYRFNSGDFC